MIKHYYFYIKQILCVNERTGIPVSLPSKHSRFKAKQDLTYKNNKESLARPRHCQGLTRASWLLDSENIHHILSRVSTVLTNMLDGEPCK